MVRPERVELPTYWFVASRSIQLSYGRTRLAAAATIDRISGLFEERNRSRACSKALFRLRGPVRGRTVAGS